MMAIKQNTKKRPYTSLSIVFYTFVLDFDVCPVYFETVNGRRMLVFAWTQRVLYTCCASLKFNLLFMFHVFICWLIVWLNEWVRDFSFFYLFFSFGWLLLITQTVRKVSGDICSINYHRIHQIHRLLAWVSTGFNHIILPTISKSHTRNFTVTGSN